MNHRRRDKSAVIVQMPASDRVAENVRIRGLAAPRFCLQKCRRGVILTLRYIRTEAEQQQEGKHMKKRAILVTCVLTAALALSACGQNASNADTSSADSQPTATEETEETTEESAPAEGGSFVFGLTTEVDNFDPFTATTADAKSIYFNIYEGLVKLQTDGTYAGAVASDYTVSDDLMTYTFTLREGVKFHNGKTVTAEDVLYSVQLAIDSKITGYDNVDTFEATDDKTIVIRLKQADVDFPAAATQAIIPEGADDNGELATAPIGTGPFAMTEYSVQDHVTLTRFEDYWGEPAHLDTVTVRFSLDASQELINFQAGAIDGFMTDAAVTQQLDTSSVTMYEAHSNAVQALYLNNAAEPFEDVRVRQALSYAIDPQEIVDQVDYGYGTVIGTAMIPALSAYYDTALADAYPTDTEKAAALLAEAGYPDGITFTVTVPSSYPVHVNTAQVLVNQLAEAGITMQINQVDWATWLENVYTNRDYEATIVSVDGAFATPTAFLSRYRSDASNNFVNYRSEEFDAHYAAAVSAADDAQRQKEFLACQEDLTANAASVYLQDVAQIMIYNRHYEGFCSYPLYAVDFSAIYQVQ